MAGNRTWFMTKPEFVGRIPERVDVLVLPRVECPICKIGVRSLEAHCDDVGGDDHLALGVMET